MSHTEEYNNYLSQINNIAYIPLYMYNSITYLSSFFYLDQNKHTYFYEGTTESILNTLPDDYDVITSYDSIAQYNVGIMQKIPNRISDNIPESNKYIDSNYNDATCTCNKCYGSGNTFSDECNICNSDEAYYKNSNCESYPTSTKGYYVLSLPHPIYRTNPLVFSTDFSTALLTPRSAAWAALSVSLFRNCAFDDTAQNAAARNVRSNFLIIKKLRLLNVDAKILNFL